MDEVFIRIRGELHYLWRAVDQHGVVLDILVQGRRNATAAKRFFKRLLAGLKYKPKRLVTDGLRSYGAARREVLPDVRHRTSRYLNNRAENLYGAFVVKRSSLLSCASAASGRGPAVVWRGTIRGEPALSATDRATNLYSVGSGEPGP